MSYMGAGADTAETSSDCPSIVCDADCHQIKNKPRLTLENLRVSIGVYLEFPETKMAYFVTGKNPIVMPNNHSGGPTLRVPDKPPSGSRMFWGEVRLWC
jgi:hypothetical protein